MSNKSPGSKSRDVNPEAFNYSDEGGGSIQSLASSFGSAEYEEIGPASLCSTGTNGSEADFVERKDADGNLLKDKDGRVIKWRIKKRAGHRRRRRRGSNSPKNNARYINGNKTDSLDEEDQEEVEMDNRIGDAEDRVNDIDYLITTGMDIDYEDTSYVTQYVQVKKKKGLMQKLGCCVTGKKKKMMN